MTKQQRTMKTQLDPKQIAWINDNLKQAALRGDTKTVLWFIKQAPEQVASVAADMEDLAEESKHLVTASAFCLLKPNSLGEYARDVRSPKAIDGPLNFTPSSKTSNSGVWRERGPNNWVKKSKGIKMLCMFMLNTAQELGLLEHQRFDCRSVVIRVQLPINNDSIEATGYVGKNPTYVGRHPDAPLKDACLSADVGTPEFDKLIARDLNKLSQEKLWWIATNMARFLDEGRAVNRALAVICSDTQRISEATLGYFFGDNGPLNLEEGWHIGAVRRFLGHKPELKVFLGPKLTAVML